jgi:N-acetylneuraminate synthase
MEPLVARTIEIGGRPVGTGHPVYVIAEIGINHNGDMDITRRLIDAAKAAGADAVKFQKRTPTLAVPVAQRDVLRETPWGIMSYMDYRERMEFGDSEYGQIRDYCGSLNLAWFASVWDEPSVDFMEKFSPVCYKVPSATLTDERLLARVRATGRPVILSTGMSTMEQIRRAVSTLGTERLVLMHCTSTYPAKADEINLRVIDSLSAEFDCPIGYSGHEVGLQISLASVALGAVSIERHITLDRSMWGTDQASSVEPQGFSKLVRDVRIIERALGDGVKRVYESELPIMKRLRRSGDADVR